jgi:prepilin-type N-terminal cleavage/methylation domain-containing protein
MAVNRKKSAFTLVEILAVLAIIAILVSLLIPALTMVRKVAKETQQKAQITTIELAIVAFKNDYGDYPPSHGCSFSGGVCNPDYTTYCGAQTLAEALVGWDLMGFHPKSAWRDDGEGKNRRDETYDPDKNRDTNGDNIPDTLTERKGPYLELATANAFRLNQLFTNTSSFNPNRFVICDVFGVKSVTIGGKTVKAGAPILYYKANTSSKTIASSESDPEKKIYNYMDNIYFVRDVKEGVNPLASGSSGSFFYEYIRDPKVTTVKWPSRPDSYILISAGVDGLYGTRDDICNFDPNS